MRIVHLSDLHFVADLGVRANRMRSKALFAKSHDVETLAQLGRTLKEISFDLVVVTGDLSTDGSAGALSQVRRFLEDPEIAPGREQLAYVRPWSGGRRHFPLRGLDGRGRFLVLPGNHDRYGWGLPFQVQRKSFEKEFSPRFAPLPYTFSALGGSVVFIVLDSTRVRTRLGRLSLKAIAEGEVDDFALEYIERVAAKARADARPGTKVAVVVALHHHPVVPEPEEADEAGPGGRSLRAGLKGVYRKQFHDGIMEMRRAGELLRVCDRANVQLVMFGHQHLHYLRRSPSGTLYSCCPASTEFSTRDEPWRTGAIDSQPGFLSYELADGVIRSVTHYRWTGGLPSDGGRFEPCHVPLGQVPVMPAHIWRPYQEALP